VKDTDLAAAFEDLFPGSTEAKGQFKLSGEKSDKGKTEGEASTDRSGGAEYADFALHLAGEVGLGVIPIVRDSFSCRWGAIDIDVYDGFDREALFQIIQDKGLCLCPTRSKSGGLHLFQFARGDVTAELMRKRLTRLLSVLGLPEDTEVFPKQDRLKDGEVGNWINLPFFAGSKTERYGWDPETGEEIRDPAQWLDFANRNKIVRAVFLEDRGGGRREVEREEIDVVQVYDDAVLPDGPICLNRLLGPGQFQEGGRNDVVYQLGVYARSRYDGDEESAREFINEMMREYFEVPLEDAERDDTLGRVIRNDANRYKCNLPIFSAVCDSAACRARRFGVRFDLHGLQIMSAEREVAIAMNGKPIDDKASDVVYRVKINWNGKDIEYSQTADKILTARLFTTFLLAKGFGAHPMDNQQWNDLVSVPINQAQTVHIEEELSDVGTFRRILVSFLEYAKKENGDRSDVLRGIPWLDEEAGVYRFRLTDLVKMIESQRFTAFGGGEIPKVLKEFFGADTSRHRIKGKPDAQKLWAVPDNIMR
jgi:hypothetical protein